MDPGEYVHEAAIREVFEETGIKCEFVSMLSARHMPEARMGNGDIYFTCLLKPLTTEIKIQEEEIAAAKWMKAFIIQHFIVAPLKPVLISILIAR